ncbi:MAG: AarF/UbiB family protein [Andreesenia angusta]|nr:AarF/UbiB family protein [Andreesenia angusta]
MKNPIRELKKEADRDREIIGVFYKYGFGAFLRQIDTKNVFKRTLMKNEKLENYTNMSRSKRLRKAIEELGPTFIKLGQLMSTRDDLLPSDIVEELKKLQENVEPYSYKKAKEIFKSETGYDMLEEFEKIDLEPLAAASIGQVYRAKLKTGENVVVKIQRPFIEEKIRMDLKIIIRLSKLIDKTINKNGIFSFEKIIDEFSNYINKELDYINEAQNASNFYKNFKGDKGIKIPKIYWNYTTRRVIVMEEILGIRINDNEKIEKLGYDKEKLAMIMANCFLKQVLIDGVFHGDPHPGNIIIIEKDKIGLIDFGIVGYLDSSTKRFITTVVKSIKDKKSDRLAEALIDLNKDVEGIDEESLKKDIHELMNFYIDTPFDRVDISKMVSDLMRVSQSYQLSIPTQLTLLAKSVVIIQGTINSLKPEFSVNEMVSEFIKDVYRSNIDFKDIISSALDFLNDGFLNFQLAPRKFNKIIDILSRNKISIKIKHEYTEDSKYFINNLLRLAIVGVLLGSMILGSALLLNTEYIQRKSFIRSLLSLNLILDFLLANIFIFRYLIKKK